MYSPRARATVRPNTPVSANDAPPSGTTSRRWMKFEEGEEEKGKWIPRAVLCGSVGWLMVSYVYTQNIHMCTL